MASDRGVWFSEWINTTNWVETFRHPGLLVTHIKTRQSRELHFSGPVYWACSETTDRAIRGIFEKAVVTKQNKKKRERGGGRGAGVCNNHIKALWDFDTCKEKSPTRACSMSRQKRMAFPTSLKLWKTSVFSSAYSMISLSWWWKNSRMPGMADGEKDRCDTALHLHF